MKEIGFYWVNDEIGSEIAYWSGIYWLVVGSELHFQDNNFTSINETQIKRDSTIQFEIDILSKYIEHPNKSGYKRNDIVDRIKELKKQLNE